VSLLQEFRVHCPPDQELRLQEFLDQGLELHEAPLHEAWDQVVVAHSFLVHELFVVQTEPVHGSPFHDPPLQLVPAQANCAIAPELHEAPKMSRSPVSVCPFIERWPLPRESSSDPVPVDLRKVCVVDGRVGFTGGVGIAQEWCGDARDEDEWRDTHLRVEGPAVDGLQSAFIQDWAETDRPLFDENDEFPVQPQRGTSTVQIVRGSASLGWDDMQSAFHVMLGSARERLRIATAYFAPDADFLDTLLAEEVASKTAKHVTMRTHLARFPFVKSLDTFDFSY
jgi:hypothetical protein